MIALNAGEVRNHEVFRGRGKRGQALLQRSFAAITRWYSNKGSPALATGSRTARGGTSIDTLAAGDAGSRDPSFRSGQGINQFDHFLAPLRNALHNTDMNGDGTATELTPAGILWLQGESDANHALAASRYGQNLGALISAARSELGAGNLPVIVGRISDSGRDSDGEVWDYGPVVREAQAAFVANDGNAALVTSTDSYSCRTRGITTARDTLISGGASRRRSMAWFGADTVVSAAIAYACLIC